MIQLQLINQIDEGKRKRKEDKMIVTPTKVWFVWKKRKGTSISFFLSFSSRR